MIKTLKAATNLQEMLFVCQEYGIAPILTESVFLGLKVAELLYVEHPDKKIALFDSDTLLEVVSYDDTKELLPYMKLKEFAYGYTVNKDGSGNPIEEGK